MDVAAPLAVDVSIPPLSARSVALSILLGVADGTLPVRDIIATGELCGIAPSTLRVALSRLVASGEVTVVEGIYTLSQHHLDRHRAQVHDLDPPRRPWTGEWELVAVIESGRDAADRVRLRSRLSADHLAALREGLWMRPANLRRPLPIDPHVTTMRAVPDDPELLVPKLWDLAAWAETGFALLKATAGPRLDGSRFRAMTALVRHLRADPILPDEFLPANWPGRELRAAYDEYRNQMHVPFVPITGELP